MKFLKCQCHVKFCVHTKIKRGQFRAHPAYMIDIRFKVTIVISFYPPPPWSTLNSFLPLPLTFLPQPPHSFPTAPSFYFIFDKYSLFGDRNNICSKTDKTILNVVCKHPCFLTYWSHFNNYFLFSSQLINS